MTATEPKVGFIAKLKQNTLYWFLLQAIVMYVGYQAFDKFYLEKDRTINAALTKNIAEVSAASLRMLGYDSYAAQKFFFGQANDLIYINATPSVYIEDGCNGLILMAFFVIFIIAYPGPILKKLWYIPFGIAVVYTINVIRCMVLAVNVMSMSKEAFDFNHKYLYSTLLYICIFGLWMLWANKLSGNNFSQLGVGNNNDTK